MKKTSRPSSGCLTDPSIRDQTCLHIFSINLLLFFYSPMVFKCSSFLLQLLQRLPFFVVDLDVSIDDRM